VAARSPGDGLRCANGAREKAKRRPKDCFNNFYFSFGSEDMVKRIGSSRLMIGSDFPHPDGTSPNTISMLKTRSGLSSQDFDDLLCGTAAEFFSLTGGL
jgi:predicted TIM-barrel fold metal-dependent hydrolase